MKRKLALFLLFSLVLLSFGLPVRLLYAHAEYEHSEPAADATIEAAPSKVKIWFTQELFRRKGENLIEVYSADGARVDQDDVQIDDDDRTLVSVSLSPGLPAGNYTVRWTATSSEDGHQEKGEFRFTVGGGVEVMAQEPISKTGEQVATINAALPPTATISAAPALSPTAEPSSSPLTCFGVSIPLMMVVGVVVAGRKSRKV